MNQVREQECPDCGAPMRFDPVSASLICDYCGKRIKMEEPEDKPAGGASDKKTKAKDKKVTDEEQGFVEGFNFDELNDLASHAGAEGLPICNCVSCGAEVITSAEQMATTCPYCGNNIVLTQKMSGNLRPDGLIPFKIESGRMPGAVRQFYKGKKLLPKGFFSDSELGKVTGVYVPFWVFSGRLSGILNYKGDKLSSTRQGNYVIKRTEHYLLKREVKAEFGNVPVVAGEKLEDALMDSLEPFEMGEVKPFDTRYLAGFTADRFDVAKDKIAGRAKSRMHSTTAGAAYSQAGAGYSNVTSSGGKLSAAVKARYLLFPVYMFNVSFNGKEYPFAVNGQTGKVAGALPIDNKRCSEYFWLRFGIVTGGLTLFSILKYFLGL